MASRSEFRRKVDAGDRQDTALDQDKPSGLSAAFLAWFWAIVCLVSAFPAFAANSLMGGTAFLLCGLISVPPLWRALANRGLALPTKGRIALIVALFFVGVAGTPEKSGSPAQRVAVTDLSTPEGRAAKLARLQAKIGPEAVTDMEYGEYREAYPKLGRAQFGPANELMLWAAVAAAENDQCPQVQVATPSLQATPQALAWTVFCNNSQNDPRYGERFEITLEQARATRDKYDPDASAEAREAALRVATAEPMSARWKNFNDRAERAAVNECKNLVRSAMVNEGSFSSAWGWDTYGSHETGLITIEQDFTAKNALGGKISSRYRCAVDPDNGSSITELQIREVTGWRKLM